MSCSASARLAVVFEVKEEDFYTDIQHFNVCAYRHDDPGGGPYCRHCGQKLILKHEGQPTEGYRALARELGVKDVDNKVSHFEALESWREPYILFRVNHKSYFGASLYHGCETEEKLCEFQSSAMAEAQTLAEEYRSLLLGPDSDRAIAVVLTVGLSC